MINNGHEEGRKVAYDEDDDDFEAMLGQYYLMNVVLSRRGLSEVWLVQRSCNLGNNVNMFLLTNEIKHHRGKVIVFAAP